MSVQSKCRKPVTDNRKPASIALRAIPSFRLPGIGCGRAVFPIS